MNTLVVYESMYGSTRLVAQAIARGMRVTDDVDVVPASHASECDVASYDLLVVGGPTHVHGLSRLRTRDAAIGAATKPNAPMHLEADASSAGVREWLSTLAPSTGMAASFDTRLDRSPLLTGRASKTIAKRLRRLGYSVIRPPESFLVDKNSRLKPHELDRAERWGRELRQQVTSGSTH
ncbi:flavodoxin [Rhodococcus sp. Eu-32]|uniref:flavodoxin family protein n=1 Tax=Rhodococcus sp. Eu-32 TaxID=1017319 RepID=UPI000DF3C785|nr:flavodoxin domain-containing protein [Rhodococcus sp. Eu-32]RRQ27182.1 flavodoxin [Rhodococcus sp. Eu-32]